MGSEKKLMDAIRIVHEFADNIIKSRMEERAEKQDEDLLSWFIRTDDNSANSAEFLRDIVINFILTGRDSMSSALTWFFWLLSSRPKIQKKRLSKSLKRYKSKMRNVPAKNTVSTSYVK
ncbi:hypothetical protein TEA_025967 [Camellia sinensis var. sinensis]|uniref:Cytochrome P450 n=1 Tax=Camellia sinensis var. sinensis TaxID=542762 RepID=A0A4S4EKL7_CAMSN|nr:hypothetical protein TEA_025967 [Camellia sinensis var. sinensis]